MDNELLKEFGLSGAVLILIIKGVFDYLKTRKKTDEPDLKEVLEKIESVLLVCEETFKMHNVKDSDGVPVWYVRRSMETLLKELVQAVNDLSKNVEIQTEIYKNNKKRD